MSAYTDALESFNRASHSDALREMQLVPQPIVGTGLGWVVPMAFVLAFAITVIGANTL